MKTFSISMSDEHAERVIDAFCFLHQYQDTIDVVASGEGEPITEETQPNPESRAKFANRMVREFIKNQVRRAEEAMARQALVLPQSVDLTDASA